jgi:hypothetical protein
MKKINYKSKGVVALVSVLIISVVGAAITITVLLLGIGFSRSSFSLEQCIQARAVVDACAEKSLNQIRNDPEVEGIYNLNLGQGSCIYTITKETGENRDIAVIGSVDNVVRKLEITVSQITPQINVSSWKEVAGE